MKVSKQIIKARQAWRSMINRCYRKNSPNFSYYGGKGIRVCDRWLYSFHDFLIDLGLPQEGQTLGRINNDWNYCPENCRWETWTQQARNRSNTIYATINAQRRPISEWIELLRLNEDKLRSNIRRGQTPEMAIYRQKPYLSPLPIRKKMGDLTALRTFNRARHSVKA